MVSLMNATQTVGRLAPSPTGAQHLGNARTYLLAWLSARASGGKVVLRIEDLDSPRVKAWASRQAVVDLKWLGLDWDEGPDTGGPHAPYVQSERTELYQLAIDQLRQRNLVYPCDCSRSDIALAASAPHAGSEGPLYPGTCACWRLGDPLPTGDDFCWRFRSQDATVDISDGMMGRKRLNPALELGDFPVTRKGGEAAYQLAVVVDDDAMGITEVVRGDDLLTSAFRQWGIYEALGLRPPRFIHVPLVVGKDGRRLAKRHGDTRLSWYREHGVTAEEIVGWAAYSAGLIDKDESVSASELLSSLHGGLQWDRVPQTPVSVEGRFPVGP
jgi:glutamyl-tRNA synthetase